MADIKVIYVNADSLYEEHSEANDSIKMQSLKTANFELTDTKLGNLVDGADANDEHIHDARYYREDEHVSTSTGVSEAGLPIVLDAGGKLDESLIDPAALAGTLDHGLLTGLGDDDHTQYLLVDGTRDATGLLSYSSALAISADTNLVHKKYVDDLFSGQEWQDSVIDRAITPPGSPSTGDRYLIDASLGTATGAWIGQEDSIAEWDGSAWVFTAPTTGAFVSADDESDRLFLYDGTNWVAKLFESTTASTGLEKVGLDIRVASSIAGDGLAFTAGVLSSNVDDTTIEIDTDILRVKADGINDTHIDFGTGTNQVSGEDIPLLDSGAFFATDNVEAALQQLAGSIENVGTEYTVGTGGVTAGDLVYVSSNDTVLPFSTLSNPDYCVGIALSTETASSTVKVLSNDTVVTGVITGATPGAKYFWDGSAIVATAPTGSGSTVWQVGVAKNATDLHVEVRQIKRNA